jgi:hypothetical protein
MSEVFVSKLTKDNLLDARNLIQLGWTAGKPSDEDYNGEATCYCLGGAIAKVLFGSAQTMYDPNARHIFEQFVTLSGIPTTLLGGIDADGNWDYSIGDPDWTASVYNFNDSTSKEEVLAAIDTAVSNIE